jgi:hypothetical protein
LFQVWRGAEPSVGGNRLFEKRVGLLRDSLGQRLARACRFEWNREPLEGGERAA